MSDTKKNRSLWATELEFNSMKQILELMRSGALVLEAPNERFSEPEVSTVVRDTGDIRGDISDIKNDIKKLLNQTSFKKVDGQLREDLRMALILLYFERSKRKAENYSKGDVYSFVNWVQTNPKAKPHCPDETEIDSVLNKLFVETQTEKKFNPFSKKR